MTLEKFEFYKKMRALRDLLYPHFREDQKKAANRIYRALHPLISMDSIDTIIDLGCGTGEILSELYKLIIDESASEKLSGISLIGIDSDEQEILEATDSIKAENQFETPVQNVPDFYCGYAENFHDTLAENGVVLKDWSKTCIICTGHTFPHFNWKKFIVNLAKQPFPKYILADYFETFDEVLKKLNSDSCPVEETMRWIPEEKLLYVRRSSAISKHTIRREVVRYKIDNASSKHEADVPQNDSDNPEIEFGVDQSRYSVECYSRLLRKHGYIQEDEFFYPAGYGPMRSYFFVHRNRHTNIINEAYYSSVNGLILQLFPEKTLETIRKIAKRVSAIVILPFDKYFTFARYSTNKSFLMVSQKDKTSIKTPTMDMQLDVPRFRNKYPFLPAPSLHACILSKGSVANVIPVSDHPEFSRVALEKSPIAKYTKQESEYLNLCKTSEIQQEIKATGCNNHEEKIITSDQKENALFFLLPFYLGKLPLFCLLIDFGDIFPYTITKNDVYDEILGSIYDMIHSAFSQEIKKKFIYDFTFLATANLLEVGNEQKSETAYSLFENALIQAKGKHWKSWLHIVPTRRISKSRVVHNEETQLSSLWESAIIEAAADPIQRGSLWLSEGIFFKKVDDGILGHDKPAPEHIRRVGTMLDKAKGDRYYSELELNSNFKYKVLKDLQDIAEGSVDGFIKYFGKHIQNNELISELKWLVENLIIIVKGLSPKQGDDSCSHASLNSFLKIKSVFCRTEGNRGIGYRFSPFGLCSSFEIYNGLPFDISNKNGPKVYFHDEFSFFVISGSPEKFEKFMLIDDQTDKIRQFCKKANRCSFVNIKKVDVVNYSQEDDVFTFKIDIYHQRLCTTGGDDWGDWKECIEEVCGYKVFEKSEINQFNCVSLTFNLRLELYQNPETLDQEIAPGNNHRWHSFEDGSPFKVELLER